MKFMQRSHDGTVSQSLLKCLVYSCNTFQCEWISKSILQFFAFGAMCTYGFDSYIKFLAWKHDEVATGGGPREDYSRSYPSSTPHFQKVIIAEPQQYWAFQTLKHYSNNETSQLEWDSLRRLVTSVICCLVLYEWCCAFRKFWHYEVGGFCLSLLEILHKASFSFKKCLFFFCDSKVKLCKICVWWIYYSVRPIIFFFPKSPISINSKHILQNDFMQYTILFLLSIKVNAYFLIYSYC